MHIDIHIPRPGLALLLVAALSGWGTVWMQSGVVPVSTQANVMQEEPQRVAEAPATIVEKDTPPSDDSIAVGGQGDVSSTKAVRQAEDKMAQARIQQQLLREKQDIITELLRGLEKERAAAPDGDPELEAQFKQASVLLASLLKDEKKAEQFILTTYHQMWEAEGRALDIDMPLHAQQSDVVVEWPVQPLLGISAIFKDAGYRARFHFDHYGIDIPVDQGSPVAAAAGGIVRDVVDHGLGFNYITVEHPGGFVTLYGHLSDFNVQPGDRVSAGEIIGGSGGRPGTPGAGFSTGPHLHFGVYVNGAAVDPQQFLPSL